MNTNTSARVDFSHDDEHKMKSAATWGIFVGSGTLVVTAIGVLAVIAAFQGSDVLAAVPGWDALVAVGNLLGPAVEVVVAIFLIKGCLALRRVATTDEDDHGQLLDAFRHLRTCFLVQGVVILTALGTLCIFFACSVVAMTAL